MIEVIGTGHILQRSVEEVKESIEEKEPDLVALELDRERLQSLRENPGYKERSLWEVIKGGGGSFLLLAYFLEKIQRKLGKNLGVAPGSEMMQALQSAQEKGSEVVLIDREIRITINHLLSSPIREKIKLLSLGGGELNGEGKEIDDLVEKEWVQKIVEEFEENTPHIYQALIKERDKFMAYNLHHLQLQNPQAHILAVVGAGHKPGVIKYLKKYREEGVGGVNLRKILEKNPVSFLQVFPLIFIVFLTFIIMQIGFWRR